MSTPAEMVDRDFAEVELWAEQLKSELETWARALGAALEAWSASLDVGPTTPTVGQHTGSPDPHPQYVTREEFDALEARVTSLESP